MPHSESVVIVGAGALGTALAHALTAAGIAVPAIASRNPERAKALARAVRGSVPVDLSDAASRGSVVLVAVSDSAIELAAASLRPRAGVIVAHTSGSRPAAALGAVLAKGAAIGGFHPLAAVVPAERLDGIDSDAWAESFRGAAFAIEGDPEVVARLSALAGAIGGVPFRIAAADKPLYHLGASMLAAFSGGLAQIAWDTMRAAGATPAIASAGVSHLLATVAGNIGRTTSPAAGLTGPVARGDAAGVRRQADTAEALSPEARAVYRVHVAHNIELARSAGRIDDATAESLRAALSSDVVKTKPPEDETTTNHGTDHSS